MDLLATVKQRVGQQYPEMAGVEPAAVETNENVTIFTFHSEVKAADGIVFPKIIRVTVENRTAAIVKVVVSKAGSRPD